MSFVRQAFQLGLLKKIVTFVEKHRLHLSTRTSESAKGTTPVCKANVPIHDSAESGPHSLLSYMRRRCAHSFQAHGGSERRSIAAAHRASWCGHAQRPDDLRQCATRRREPAASSHLSAGRAASKSASAAYQQPRQGTSSPGSVDRIVDSTDSAVNGAVAASRSPALPEDEGRQVVRD